MFFSSSSPAPSPPPAPRPKAEPTESDFEQFVLAFWLRRMRDLDDVTVIVRRRGQVVRTLLLSPDGDPTPSSCSGESDTESR